MSNKGVAPLFVAALAIVAIVTSSALVTDISGLQVGGGSFFGSLVNGAGYAPACSLRVTKVAISPIDTSSASWEINVFDTGTGDVTDTQNVGDGESKVINNVECGKTYKVKETQQLDWGVTSIVVNDNPDGDHTIDQANAEVTVEVDEGENVEVKFTNGQGIINIEKQTDPDGDTTSFGFESDVPPTSGDQDFNLQDDQTKSYLLPPGTYEFTETVPTGWTLESIECTGGSAGADIASATATITLQAGEVIKCTFNDKKETGTIIIKKDTSPDTNPAELKFDMVSSTAPASFSLGDGEQQVFADLDPGTYNFEEIGVEGWVGSVSCDAATGWTTETPDNSNGAAVTVELQADQVITCTFFNKQGATIKVNKATLPDDADPEDFGFTGDLDSSNAPEEVDVELEGGDSETFTVEAPGTYTFTEVLPPLVDTPTETISWQLTDITCTTGCAPDIDAMSATCTVNPGDAVECTFKNEKTVQSKLGKIIIKKSALLTDADEQFKFTGDLGEFLLKDAQSKEFADKPAGTYTVHEDGGTLHPEWWKLYKIECVDPTVDTLTDPGGAMSAEIHLAGGETVECTFFDGSAEFKIKKSTNPPGEAQQFSIQGQPDLDGTAGADASLADGQSQTFRVPAPQTYVITETLPEATETEEWDVQSPISVDCLIQDDVFYPEKSVSIHVEPGDEDEECTFKNEKTEFGIIIGKKWLDADRDGFQDAGEPGLEGWVIRAKFPFTDFAIISATTDEDGDYVFPKIQKDTIVDLCEVMQPGFVEVSTPFNVLPIECEEALGEGPTGFRIVLEGDADAAIANFGNDYERCTITGTKFDDIDGDGVQDLGEPGVEGVTVYAYPPFSSTPAAAALTGNNGVWTIPGIVAGNYDICEVIEPNFVPTFPILGATPLAISCNQAANLNPVGYNIDCDDDGETFELDFGQQVVVCGDGNVDPGEECDDGNTNNGDGCDEFCQNEPFCGDGVVEGGEQCDDGNANGGDGCSAACQIEVCGNGIVEGGPEQCDDSNVNSGDGCNSFCDVEEGYTCASSPSTCTTVCGDGIITGSETCEDGNTANGDGCSSACTLETIVCGNGVQQPSEACDDGNTANGDGCSSTCRRETADLCNNPYFSTGQAGSTSISSLSVSPSTSAGTSQVVDITGRSPVTAPTTLSGANNCFDGGIYSSIRWNNDFVTGLSDKIVVNTPQETLATVNFDESSLNNVEIRWYTQDGTVPAGMSTPEIRIIHSTGVDAALHTAVTNGANKGDMVLVTVTSNGDLHVGRYKANSTAPIVWQTSLDDTLNGLYFVDYNAAAGVVGILARSQNDIVVYTINVATGAVINRVAVDSGAIGNAVDVGHGMKVDASGDVYVSYSEGFPGPYHAAKLSGTSIVWSTILSPGLSYSTRAQDNMIALIGTNLYVGGNIATAGAQVYRLSQATGAANYQNDLDVVGAADIFLNGIIPAKPLNLDGTINTAGTPRAIFFYGTDKSTTPSRGMAGRINDTLTPWFRKYADTQEITGVADANFARIMLVGKGPSFYLSGPDTKSLYVLASGGGVDSGQGATVDIANDAVPDSATDVVLRPTAGFFDIYTVLADNRLGGDDTKLYQNQFAVAAVCGNNILEAGEQCDDGNTANGDGCSSTCQLEGVVCGNGVLQTGEQCDDGNTAAGDCCSPTCQFESAATQCRASAGTCDVAEFCTGSSGTCPVNGFQPSSTQCRASAGTCDVAEFCTGISATCPVDSFQSSSTLCRASAGVCDVAELCTGSSASCPADTKQSSSTVCRASAGTCDITEFCDGSSNDCPVNNLVSAGTECRASAGVCDTAEACTGIGPDCPADFKEPSSTICRASAGACDVAESCDGVSDNCPLDAFQSSSTQCRASAGTCDVAEFCTGSGAPCPADGFQPFNTECRASAGVCDVAEVCSGSSASCPTDGFASSGTECRASAGVCDVAEVCSGSSASCPTDGFASSATQCRADAGECDVDEFCTGSSASCPADGFEPLSTVCTTTSPNPANHCNGAGSCVCNPISNTDSTCNGVDDDCDGFVDEDFASQATSCGVGACAATGQTQCVNGQVSDTCTPGTPTAEVCNNIDDDCDGFTDEDASGNPLTQACYTGPAGTQDVGVCHAGTQTCTGGTYGACTGQVTPITETCNGLDNDCDGFTDEDFNVGGTCTVGVGSCAATGVFICTLDGSGTVCTATAGTPSTEVCDGADNDCDGLTDEGNVCDVTPPQTTITSATDGNFAAIPPGGFTGSDDATFTFTGSDDFTAPGDLTFECSIDAGAFVSCTSPDAFSGLGDGSHTFEVQATDEAGNTDPTPATFTWLIDTTPPVITTASVTPSLVGTTAQITITKTVTDIGGSGVDTVTAAIIGPSPSTGTIGTVSLSLISGTAQSGTWSGTFTFPSQLFAPDGTYTVVDTATDEVGNSATETDGSVTLDRTGPIVTIISIFPAVTTSAGTVTVIVTASDATSGFASTGSVTLTDTTSGTAGILTTFSGSLAAGGTGTWTFSLAADPPQGTHTVVATGTDLAGNSESDSATYIVDDTPPDTTITSAIDGNSDAVTAGGTTGSDTISFTFTGSDNVEVDHFECRLDGGTFTACTSPQGYSGLSDGSHTFEVRAVDTAGNADTTPATFTWTIDTDPPETTITSAINGDSDSIANGGTSDSSTQSFTFTADEAGSTFECNLDSAGFVPCTSGQTYTGLADGLHTFEVRATDPYGNTDPTPATFTWTVDTTPPETTITSATDGDASTITNGGFANTGTATFTFTANEAGSTFECSIDNGAFVACDSPEAFTGLSDGTHTFEVRATDPAGNTDPTPATFTWTIDTVDPTTTKALSDIDGDNTIDQIVLTCNDGGSGCDKITWEINNGPTQTHTCSGTPCSVTITPPTGTFIISFRSTDKAGNVEASTTQQHVGDGCPSQPGDPSNNGCPEGGAVCTTEVRNTVNIVGKNEPYKQQPLVNSRVVMLAKAQVQCQAGEIAYDGTNAASATCVQNLLDSGAVWALIDANGAWASANTFTIFLKDTTGKAVVTSSVADPNGWAIYETPLGATIGSAGTVASATPIAVANTDCAPKKHLQWVAQRIGSTSTFMVSPARQQQITGSLLDIVYPEQAIWEADAASYLYPFIFTSDSEWTVDVCALVPQGYAITGAYDETGSYVTSASCAQTFVTGQTRVLAFEVQKTGSPPEWSFGANIKAKDPKGKINNVNVEIPTKISEKIAKKEAKGGEFGKGFARNMCALFGLLC